MPCLGTYDGVEWLFEMTSSRRRRKAPPPPKGPGIVVDGDVSAQRVDALVNFGHEEDELDFKKELDFTNAGPKKGKLGFVADIAALAASNGGYILAGVEEVTGSGGHSFHVRGMTSTHQAPFDVSNIRQMVEEYVSVAVDLRVAIVESIAHVGKKLGVICVMPANEFPIVMTKDGVYKQLGEHKFVFKEGDVLVRRNASTVRANQADVRNIVSRIRRVERQSWAEELAESGIAEILESLRQFQGLVRAATRPGRRKEIEPRRQLLLGPDDAFRKKFLDALEESANE